jgi:hypothetical protein
MRQNRLVPIYSPREILTFDEQLEDLRERPPVFVWKPFLNKGLAAYSFRVSGWPITRDRMPDNVGARFDELTTEFNKVLGERISVGVEGPAVRAAYRTFARVFYPWAIELRAPPPQQHRGTRLAIAPLDSDRYRIPSTLGERAILAFIYSAPDPAKVKIRSDNRAVFTYRQPQGTVDVSRRDWEGANISMEEVAKEAYAALSQYDDLTADVFLALIAHWAERRDRTGHTWVTADAIIEERNLVPKTKLEGGKRYKAGHRAEDRAAILRCVEQLEGLWITLHSVEVHEGFGKKRKAKKLNLEARYFVIDQRITQDELDRSSAPPPQVVAWRYKLGESAEALAADRQFTFLARQVLQYDHARRIPEKRLGRYFTFHHQIAKRTAVSRRIKDLFEQCSLSCDSSRPERTKERFVEAMNRLQNDGVIGKWSYANGHREAKLPPRKWFDTWVEWVITVEPPTDQASLAQSPQGLPPAEFRQPSPGRPRRYRG